jgi:hypothetical protein
MIGDIGNYSLHKYQISKGFRIVDFGFRIVGFGSHWFSMTSEICNPKSKII